MRALTRWLPSSDELRRHRALRWMMGPLLDRPWLWSMDRQSVASGIAIGLLLAFLIPAGQFLLAALVAAWARANLPVAVAATFVSNPFTTPAILAGAYYVGATALGLAPTTPLAEGLSGVERAAIVGTPLLAGLAILAAAASVSGYLLVHMFWRAVAPVRACPPRSP